VKTKILNWITSNFRTVLLIGLLIIAFFFLRKWGTGYYEYKHEIKVLNDSIVKLDKEYSWIQKQFSSSLELTNNAINEANLIRDSLRNAKNEIYINNINHEREIANLTRIPIDALYVNFTTWLDTLSFE